MTRGGSSAPIEVLHRQRLLDRLVPRPGELILISAGPGMGKTILLEQLTADRCAAGTTTLALYCTDLDEVRAVRDIGAGSTARAGRAFPRSNTELSGTIVDLINELWTLAPHDVTVTIDDAHHLGHRGIGALAHLVDHLPRNAELVVASRESLARLAAVGGVNGTPEIITEADMLFDDHELAALTASLDIGDVEPLRWPARATLAIAVGADVADDYVWDEVLRRLTPPERRLLATAAYLGSADADLIRACCNEVDDLRGTFAPIPLVTEGPPGQWSVHALWDDVLAGELDRSHRETIDRAAAARHFRDGDAATAVNRLLRAHAWDDVLDLAVNIAADPSMELFPEQLRRWIGEMPPSIARRPEGRLLIGVSIMSTDPDRAFAELDAVRREFDDNGSLTGQLAALRQLTRIAVWRQDAAQLAPLIAQVATHVAAGHDQFCDLHQLHRALIASVTGDNELVIDLTDDRAIDASRTFEPVVRWLRGFALLDSGQPDLARCEGELGLAAGPSHGFELPLQSLIIESVFETEGVAQAFDRLEAVMPAVESTGIDQFVGAAAVRLVAAHAYLGEPASARAARQRYSRQLGGLESATFAVLRAIADASIEVATGDRQTAADILQRAAEIHPVSSPQAQGAWSRHAALVAALLPIDAASTWQHSPFRARAFRFAAAMRRLWSGAANPALDLEPGDIEHVNSHLPRQWIAELAHGAAREIAEGLIAQLGAHAERHVAAAAPAAATTVASRSVPETPSEPIEIRLLGSFEIARGGRVIHDNRLDRRRVRELLALLVYRGGEVERAAAAALMWPDKSLERGAQNLRVNLSHLISALEPTRPRGAPSFFVRHVGRKLVLSDELVTVDVVEFDHTLAAAQGEERLRRIDRAVELYLSAIRLWRGHPEVFDVAWAPEEAERLRSSYVAATVRVADLTLAGGDHDEAWRLAGLAMEAAPWSFEPIRVGISAGLAGGRQTDHLVTRTQRIARELGVAVPGYVHEIRS